MFYQPEHGMSYIGRFPDKETAVKKKKADGAIDSTAFTRSTIDSWYKLENQ
jgi:hypothetical protein